MSTPCCPNCDLTLRPMTARGRGDHFVLLGQCNRCGGLWCDRWQFFPSAAAEVASRNPVDQAAVWAPVADVKRDLSCPRCRKPLQRFRDPLLPDDARIEHCRLCEGVWMNRGELRGLEVRRGALTRLQPLSEASIRSLAKHLVNTPNWSASWRVKDANTVEGSTMGGEEGGVRDDLKDDGHCAALRLLLRILFRL